MTAKTVPASHEMFAEEYDGEPIIKGQRPKQRRGRDTFRRFQSLIDGLSVVASVLPPRICLAFLAFARNWPGVLGIAVRYVLVKRVASGCGDVVAIRENVFFTHLDRCRFGDHVSVHPMCYIQANGGLSIGDNVSIAHGVSILTEEHDFEQPNVAIRDAAVKLKPVSVGDDVWIGAGVRILAGVNIGDRVVIGAGAVVTRDVPSNSLALGVPARVVRAI